MSEPDDLKRLVFQLDNRVCYIAEALRIFVNTLDPARLDAPESAQSIYRRGLDVLARVELTEREVDWSLAKDGK